MAVILYCQETPNLKLGPGVKDGDPDIITFRDGYAEIDPADPLFKQKMMWLAHPGTPFIRVLGEDESPTTDPNAVTCPACGKSFAGDTREKSEQKLNGHLIQHRKG